MNNNTNNNTNNTCAQQNERLEKRDALLVSAAYSFAPTMALIMCLLAML